MGSVNPNYILDTNVVLAIIRGKELGNYIERHYRIRSSPFRPFISIVTLAELYTMARRHEWGDQKYRLLATIEEELVVVNIDRRELAETYAEIRIDIPKGVSIGQNDIWIAATAKVLGATLLTTDTDFDHMQPTHIQRIWIDPAKVR